MRCLGCENTIKSLRRAAESWKLFQLCASCFSSLVPDFYMPCISARMMRHGR